MADVVQVEPAQFQTPQEAAEKWRRVQLSSVQLTSYFSGYGNAPVRVIGQLMQ
jgi:hypothetical protein